MNKEHQISDYIERLCRVAGDGAHRAVAVLSGEPKWCRDCAGSLLAATPQSATCWVGGSAPERSERLEWSRARTLLGTELERLVIDAFDGFDAEGFGAISGTVRAGGLLLLLVPPLEQWPEYDDPQHLRLAQYPHSRASISGRFLQRMAGVLQNAVGVALLRQGEPLPPLPAFKTVTRESRPEGVCATAEQQEAVAAVRHVAQGHAHRPLVLSADRGRGKSAALGIAAAELLQNGCRRVVVTAPRIDAAAQVFAFAAQLLPGCESSRGEVVWQGRTLRFAPPDALVAERPEAQLLLVDEAAAIPTPLLESMLSHYPRSVFATTIHGYEGTGRGFAVRFQQVLNRLTPQWRSMHLSTPVRWAEGDPLERLTFEALLLDAEPVAAEAVAGATPDSVNVERLDGERLLRQERDLSELFGLLVLAHYRTSPNDLRQLLDGPQQSLYVLRQAGHIVATALVVDEGELDAALAREVWLGRRRVQGHLLPQSLANHAGFAEAAELHAARVMRIAVHPALQGRGLGSLLLEQVKRQAQARGCDYFGASFGATAELLQFWSRCGLVPVRIGLSREASSGSHSAIVMAPLSSRGEVLFHQVKERFAELLPELLAEPLASLEDELAAALLAMVPPKVDETLGTRDRLDLESFAFGLRGYELCMPAVRKLVMHALSDEEAMAILNEDDRRLLRDKVLQRHHWKRLVAECGFSGRKQALAALRAAVAKLCRHYFGES